MSKCQSCGRDDHDYGLCCGRGCLVFIHQGGITGAWDAATGTLTLIGVATVAAYETILRSVSYSNISDALTGTGRKIIFQIDDGGATDNQSIPVHKQVTITLVNGTPAASDDVVHSSNVITEDAVTIIETATLLANDNCVCDEWAWGRSGAEYRRYDQP
ncbi:hypothetical protein [uncultured Tateyamaria sp.]|uniref:hypothetical protein n=1 Tax=uncultured Tateyamaria sp. TaxID=455651 RepID=UPI00263680DD|nr:hypothetical protein [uncultured Tateyamaria sp.]